MRINQFVAKASGLSRRASDTAITDGRVTINGKTANLGQQVNPDDAIKLDGKILKAEKKLLIMLNKPTGYICSRNGQGGKTIYDLLPAKYHNLKPIGRLDKDSSGLLLLTNDGQLAQELTHPKYQKTKIYEIELDKPLTSADQSKIKEGIKVENYISRLKISTVQTKNYKLKTTNRYEVALAEGKNRQIRRTLAALGYTVTKLHRTSFGRYELYKLATGEIREV